MGGLHGYYTRDNFHNGTSVSNASLDHSNSYNEARMTYTDDDNFNVAYSLALGYLLYARARKSAGLSCRFQLRMYRRIKEEIAENRRFYLMLGEYSESYLNAA